MQCCLAPVSPTALTPSLPLPCVTPIAPRTAGPTALSHHTDLLQGSCEPLLIMALLHPPSQAGHLALTGRPKAPGCPWHRMSRIGVQDPGRRGWECGTQVLSSCTVQQHGSGGHRGAGAHPRALPAELEGSLQGSSWEKGGSKQLNLRGHGPWTLLPEEALGPFPWGREWSAYQALGAVHGASPVGATLYG